MGRTNSKLDEKREAYSQAVIEMTKTLIADKEVSSEKTNERKCQEKEDTVKRYCGIQHKKFKIEEINAHNKQKELELAVFTEEAKLMETPMPDDMDPTQRAWLEKQKMILES
jgi:hypothetical protein